MEISEAREFLTHNHHGVLVARKKDGSLQMTLQRAIEYAGAALSSLDGLPDSIHKQALSSIPGYIVERDR